MMKRAFVAGKITGLPKDQVKSKFNMLADQLHNMGYHVIKPTGLSDHHHTWDTATRNDIKKMLECDEVHLLPDWQESRGAQLHRDIALRLGMQVVYH